MSLAAAGTVATGAIAAQALATIGPAAVTTGAGALAIAGIPWATVAVAGGTWVATCTTLVVRAYNGEGSLSDTDSSAPGDYDDGSAPWDYTA